MSLRHVQDHKKTEETRPDLAAADDFPMIRARMEELRRERARPRAADDFAMIRARMEELRRERAQVGNKCAGPSRRKWPPVDIRRGTRLSKLDGDRPLGAP